MARNVGQAVAAAAKARPLVPATDNPRTPAIPVSILDAPSQRRWALAVYVALLAWRLYDYSTLVKDDADSLFYFMKWTMMDGLFMYGLPALRIPWLEWSGPTSLALFVAHAFLDWILMFRVAIPVEAWLVGLTKILYDRELAVSEKKVNPQEILRNSALILGKHTIHILPEGSAVLNPAAQSYCLDSFTTYVDLPIHINQTSPILMELTRVDLEDGLTETLSISAKQAKALTKQAERHLSKRDTSSPRKLQYRVKKTGLYRLQKVVDESGLEVRRKQSEALVVDCPHAEIKPSADHRCKGELSNLVLALYGSPPFKLKYSRTVNSEDRTFSFQSIQPENWVSPVKGDDEAGALVVQHSGDVSWARAQHIEVPLNESLNTLGRWMYLMEEVQDAFGNSVNYTLTTDYGERVVASKYKHIEHAFTVHPRPKASLATKDSPCTIRVAHGTETRLPIAIDDSEGPYTVSTLFTPLEDLPPNGEHSAKALVRKELMKTPADKYKIIEPGLYSLQAISSRFCAGEVLEPSSCLLINPPLPTLSLSSENIYDSCAGNPIGLQVDIDLIGTPPFEVSYEISSNDRKALVQKVSIDGLRHQLTLKPTMAGHYRYRFNSIKDSLYNQQSLDTTKLVIEQDVRPPASARFNDVQVKRNACLGEGVPLDIILQGEGPWTLEYEVVHNGKRSKYRVEDIQDPSHTIYANELNDGGEYIVALVSVQDKTRCKVLLSEEAKINVRQQLPKAAFAPVDGRYMVTTLEGQKVSLPLRLTGQPPWSVEYRRKHEAAPVMSARLDSNNAMLEVRESGAFEILTIHDAACRGIVEKSASSFDVEWVARPSLRVAEGALVELVDGRHVKKDVCEGDDDVTEIMLQGHPPFYVKYQQRVIPNRGSTSVSNKEFTAGLSVASIQMETATPGIVEYLFTELADNLYDYDKRKHQPLALRQRVNKKPSAAFAVPGKTYKYCKDEQVDEVIPLVLDGAPPFYLELAIKHQRHAEPEVVRVPGIEAARYDFRVPHRLLALGSHSISVRKVRDAHGCQRKYDAGTPTVYVSVADAPAIAPLEAQAHYCVGDWIAFSLSGTPPFHVYYTFQGVERRAAAASTSFRRIAESPGEFTITAVADQASDCKAKTHISKIIHPLPTVKISRGRETSVDIHEGGTAEILFEFTGTPPFEFTYTRSEAMGPAGSSSGGSRGGAAGGSGSGSGKRKSPRVLETRSDTSHEFVKAIVASDEGTYEAVAIRDRFCGFSKFKKGDVVKGGGGGSKQKMIGL